MITYSGTIVALTDSPSGFRLEEHNFTVAEIEVLVDEAFSDHVVERRSMVDNGNFVIAFFSGSNHDRGLRDEIVKLFENLSAFGAGVFASCSMYDDEAGNGLGEAWELRLNHPSLEIEDVPVQRVDFTKRD